MAERLFVLSRIAMCTEVTADDLMTSHREVGHMQYYLQYKHQPYVFQEDANPGGVFIFYTSGIILYVLCHSTHHRCHLVWFTHNPHVFLRFTRAYGHTMQFLWIFMIFADSNLQSFHALYSNCCQFAMTPDMLREHESK